jgi:hypothetical protein
MRVLRNRFVPNMLVGLKHAVPTFSPCIIRALASYHLEAVLIWVLNLLSHFCFGESAALATRLVYK